MVDSDESIGKCVAKTCAEHCLETFVCFLFTTALTFFFIWLGNRDSIDDPKCSIQNFYVPALNKTLDSKLNTTLNFMVRFDNPNKDKLIYYDDVNITISTTNHTIIGNYTVPKFYQGIKHKVKKWGHVVPVNDQTVLGAVLPNGSAVFRLDLETQVRFLVGFWKTKRFSIEVGADVEVNGDGTKAKKKGIKLKKSDSSFLLRRSFMSCVLINLIVFFTLLPI